MNFNNLKQSDLFRKNPKGIDFCIDKMQTLMASERDIYLPFIDFIFPKAHHIDTADNTGNITIKCKLDSSPDYFDLYTDDNICHAFFDTENEMTYDRHKGMWKQNVHIIFSVRFNSPRVKLSLGNGYSDKSDIVKYMINEFFLENNTRYGFIYKGLGTGLTQTYKNWDFKWTHKPQTTNYVNAIDMNAITVSSNFEVYFTNNVSIINDGN